MGKRQFQNSGILAAVAGITIAAVAACINGVGLILLPADALMATRLIAALGIVFFAFKRRTLTAWIFAGLVVGAEIGYDWPSVGVSLQLLSQIFLRLIKTIIAPLIFSTLVVGIAGHANIRQVGRMAVKGLVYFEAVTTFAFLIGIAVVNILKPGVGIDSSKAVGAGQIEHIKHSASDIILNAFPENIAKAVAEGQILQVVIFSVIFAIAISMLSQEKRAPMFNVVKSLSEIMFKVTKIVMYFAPLGVCGSVAYIVGHEGLGVVLEMLKLLAALYTAMIAFVILVLLPVGLIAGVPIRRFVRAAIEPVTIAFATTNSEAAMPDAMQKMRSIGVPEEVVSFIFPLGYSFNLDGSSLYLSLATVFVAQAAGIQMSLTQQMIMVFTLMLTSKGVAGVSRGAFVILSAMVMDLNLPVEPLLLILGIDHFMDMARTAVNVLGNCLATVVIARWEGVYDKDQA